jgi:hypothetical protein
MSKKNLSFDARINLTKKMIEDFCFYKSAGFTAVPEDQQFTIKEGRSDSEQLERVSFLKELADDSIKKVAFDTRFIDQERERNPRENLQYWQRTQEFVPLDTQRKLVSLNKVKAVTQQLREKYGNQQEWLQSYAKQLDEHLSNATMVKDGGVVEVFEPQVRYLEQLIDTRYLLRLAEIETMKEEELGKVILSKDNKLAAKIAAIGVPEKKESAKVDVDQKSMGDALSKVISALFGGELRKDGEKNVERTITITIKDNVVE